MTQSTICAEFDPLAFRAQFPLFAQAENARLVYLDNAATTQKPQCVIDAITQFYLHGNANAHRASHRLARAATDMLEQVREKTARWINAGSSAEIVFCRGATEGLNLLAHGLTQALRAGDEIILSVAEHHANLVPWQMAAQRHGLVLKFVPLRDGALDFDRLPALLGERTRIVALTAASNALGFCVDVAALARAVKTRAPDIVLVVDAAQAIAHATVDVTQWNCDFLVASAHKFYGPTGIGFVYGRSNLWQVMPPWQGGGEMIDSVTLQSTTFAAPPHRFEAGTSALASIAGLGAAIDFLRQQPRAAMQRHEAQLVYAMHERLARLPWLQLLSSAPGNVGMAAFRARDDVGIDHGDIALWLDGHDIAVRSGTHCAQPLVQQLGGAWLRASVAAYNTVDDIARLCDALACLPLPSRAQSAAAAAATDAPATDDLAGLSLDALTATRGWQARYALLLQWGERLAPKPAIRRETNRVAGCEAAVWLVHHRQGERHRFAIDSDARVIRGLAVLLLLLIDARSDAELAALDLPATLQALGLARHLSPSRVNGFRALVDQALRLAGHAGHAAG